MKNPLLKNVILFILASWLFAGCDAIDSFIPSPTATPPPSVPEPQAMVTFRVTLPSPLPAGESVNLILIDEITGLPFNQKRIAMTLEDASHLIVIVPLPIGSFVKYRYARQGAYLAQEYTPDGRPVRYRGFNVVGPAKVEDIVSRWVDTANSHPGGRIIGSVVDKVTGKPVPDMLVMAGGMQASTSANGSFLFEDLPPGTHNLVVLAPNGQYKTFQQGASVAVDSATPAEISLEPVAMADVEFIVQVPPETPAGASVRIVGSLAQFGATFSEQRGEISILAGKSPEMVLLPDGRYRAKVKLPIGVEIRYRYTLGDGLWNAEHTTSGNFGERRLVVTSGLQSIEDSVYTWKLSDPGPITFAVRVPSLTLARERISIQFNPGYGWTEPLPMWPAGQNKWFFTLFSPMVGVQKMQYRYCREQDCGSADEASATGMLAKGRTVEIQPTPQTISDQVDAWAWYQGQTRLAVVPSVQVKTREPGFVAGVAFQASGYNPNWDAQMQASIQDVSQINANWLYFSPTWGIIRNSPPVFEPVQGMDMPVGVISATVQLAQSSGLKVGLFPILRYPGDPADWWQNAPRSFPWWVSWYDAYREFLVNSAILAEETHSRTLILGAPDIAPALPEGILQDGSASGAPADAEIRWTEIISDVRSHFSGSIYWAMAYPQQIQNRYKFLERVDGIYVLWSVKLADQQTLDQATLVSTAGNEIDSNLLPLVQTLSKPLVLAVSYPSARGALTGCVIAQEGMCASFLELERPQPDLQGVTLDLDEQEAAYNAIFQAVNQRAWLSGLVSQGYYIPEPLQDKSLSVRGKPAAGVLWFWFAKFLGK